jgi:predicted Zn-dependent peptidase
MRELFAGHAYGRPVYGDSGVIQDATVERLQAFYRRLLLPGRCALSVIGDFNLTEMEKEIRRNWGALAKGAATTEALSAVGRLEKSVERQVELDIQESHLFLGWQAPEFNHEQRLTVSLLTNILGSGINPLLHEVLFGRRRLAEQLDMSYIYLRHGGMLLLHLTLKEKDIRSAKSAVGKFLREINSINFSREDIKPEYQSYMLDYLESAKNRMAFQAERFRESVLNLSTASARFLLLNRHAITGNYLESVEKISSTDLRQAAGKYLSGKKWVALAITPLTGKQK